jgi:hypothetical protein
MTSRWRNYITLGLIWGIATINKVALVLSLDAASHDLANACFERWSWVAVRTAALWCSEDAGLMD